MKTLELKCYKNDFNANGYIKYNDKEYKFHNLIKDEIAIFEVLKDNKNPLRLLEIKTKSKNRIEPLCKESNICGGCQFSHVTYDYEIDLKNSFIKDLFKSFKASKIDDVIKMDDPYFYRNKCQMTYKLSKTGNVVCGFYEEGTHKIVPVTSCKIQSIKGTNIINEFNKVLTKNHIKPYSENSRSGVIRHVLVRYGFNTDEVMLVIITNGQDFPGRKNVINDLLKLNLGITTIVQNFNSRDTSIVLGQSEKVLYGPGFIYDKIGDIKFKISARSFYQVNTIGMNILYKTALDKAKILKTDTVLDTYCGVGTIGILASKYAKKVYGVELNKDAYHDAILNAKINNIKNIEFFNSDSTKFLEELNDEKIDLLIMDPPRDGTTDKFIDAALKLKIKKILYISCNPLTLLRDLNKFKTKGYNLKELTPVDMFPRTSNLECISILELNDKIKELKNSQNNYKKTFKSMH